MRHWIAVLLTTLTGAALAQTPSLSAATLRFDPPSLPQTMAAYRLWLASGRGVGASDAAMALVAPGITLNAANHAQYAAKIQPMIAAIGKRLAEGNADKAEPEADVARRLGALVTAAEWQALLDGARAASANTAAQSYIDATLAIAMLSAAGVGEQTSPEASRLWPRVRGMASAYDPVAGKGRLQPGAPAEQAAFDKLKSAVDQFVTTQRARSSAAALALARDLYPDYASGKARQIGSAAKIEVLIESLRMPELARFYGALWADIQTAEVLLRVHELARAAGRPENWDSDGSRRPRLAEFILPRVQKLGADAPMSDALAAMLTELISDVDVEWMRNEAASARGQKLMPTVERLIIASFWRRGIESSRVWQGGTYRSGEVAQAAIDALRGDPAGRDPVMKRLEPLEQKSKPVYDRVVQYQVERTRAAVAQVMKRDDREIRALLNSLK